MNELLFVLVATVCTADNKCDLHAIDSGLTRADCRAYVGALDRKHRDILRDIGGQLVALACVVEDLE